MTAAIVGEGLLIGNYKGWADTLSKKKYIGFVGKQAKGIRGGLDTLMAYVPKKSVTKNIPIEKPPENKPAPQVDLTAFQTLGDFTGENVVAKRAEKIFDDIEKQMQPLNGKYNIDELFPNGIPKDFSLPGFEQPMVQELARELIQEAHGHGDKWQELIFGIEDNGAYSLLKSQSKVEISGWAEAIQEMIDKGVLERLDIHENAFAVFINNKFGELLLNIPRGN